MGVSIESVPFVMLTCDLCRKAKVRMHEPKSMIGDLGERIREELPTVDKTLPKNWVSTSKDLYVCPECVGAVVRSNTVRERRHV